MVESTLNKGLLFIPVLFLNIFASEKPETVKDNEFNWKYVTLNNEADPEAWRKEMNYWYDQCAQYNNEKDSMPLNQKIKLFLSNKKLEDRNEILNRELALSFPKTYALTYKQMLSLESEKRLELQQIRDQVAKRKDLTKENPEIATLQKELDNLDQTYQALHKECLDQGYIPTQSSKVRSIAEEEKITLEKEYLNLQKKVAESKIKTLEDKIADKESIIEEQKQKLLAQEDDLKILERGRKKLAEICKKIDDFDKKQKSKKF